MNRISTWEIIGFLASVIALGLTERPSGAADWPQFGRDATRNSVSLETGAPTKWRPERLDRDGKVTSEARGIRWSAPLGISFASPVTSGGLVWIGCGDMRTVKEREGYHSLLRCFRVADGKQVYEYVSPQLGAFRWQDASWSGLGSSPLIEGDRLWITTNRCEVLCLDIGPLIRGEGVPRELWKLDLIEQFGIHPRVASMGPPRPCSIGSSWKGRIFITLNNGISNDHRTIPQPEAPSLVCLNKETGEVHWKDNSPGANILMSQFASPTIAEIAGHAQVIVPQSDGWLRGFDPETGKKLWEFDVNLKASSYTPYKQGDRNDLFANAVVYEERVYVASGRDAEQGEGPGRLVCVDPTKRGDVSSELAVDAAGKPLPRRRLQAVDAETGEKAIPNPNSALVWEFIGCGEEFTEQMHRSLNSVAIARGLVIAADAAGAVHCFDAKTGKRHWSHDVLAFVWSSPLIVDDKVFVGDEDGEMAVFQLSADPKHAEPIATIVHQSPIYGSAAYANGTLYVPTRDALIAVDSDQARRWQEHVGDWPQWRGPRRDNRSSEEGLLASWPAEGPPLMWRVDGLGDGIASLALVDGRLFTTTTYGESEFAIALDEATGERLWATRISSAVQESPLMRWLSQRTAVVDGERVFVYTNTGWLVCLNARDGSVLWRVSYPHEFGTPRGRWGFCDRPLVDGDHVICTPGGSKATIAALDKATGKVVWSKLSENREASGYAASLIVETEGLKQYVMALENGLASFAAADGRLLWRDTAASDSRANSSTPLIVGDGLLCPNVYGSGMSRLKLTRKDDDVFAELIYYQKASFDPFEDSTVLVDDRLYGFGSGGIFLCLDATDGKRLTAARGPGTGKAAATYADGRLYARWSNGVLALLDATTPAYSEKGRFTLAEPRSSLGATLPIVAGGRLFVRDNDRLYCFEVRERPAGTPLAKPSLVQLTPPEDADAKPRPIGERVPNAIFVPTPDDVVEKMLAAADLGKDDVVYDLGSGDGRIVIAAAKKSQCRAVGLELDRDLVKLSQQRVSEAKLEKLVTIKEADLFDADFSEASVVTVYLYPGLLKRLLPKLDQLKPGTRIVSHQFEIPDYPAETKLNVESQETGAKHSIYLWTTPLGSRWGADANRAQPAF